MRIELVPPEEAAENLSEIAATPVDTRAWSHNGPNEGYGLLVVTGRDDEIRSINPGLSEAARCNSNNIVFARYCEGHIIALVAYLVSPKLYAQLQALPEETWTEVCDARTINEVVAIVSRRVH